MHKCAQGSCSGLKRWINDGVPNHFTNNHGVRFPQRGEVDAFGSFHFLGGRDRVTFCRIAVAPVAVLVSASRLPCALALLVLLLRFVVLLSRRLVLRGPTLFPTRVFLCISARGSWSNGRWAEAPRRAPYRGWRPLPTTAPPTLNRKTKTVNYDVLTEGPEDVLGCFQRAPAVPTGANRNNSGCRIM